MELENFAIELVKPARGIVADPVSLRSDAGSCLMDAETVPCVLMKLQESRTAFLKNFGAGGIEIAGAAGLALG